jgi:hypothetical protein
MSVTNYWRPEDKQLAEEIGNMLWHIEGNYNREGSGPGSRFEGQRLEIVQAHAVIRRIREHLDAAEPVETAEQSAAIVDANLRRMGITLGGES